MDRKILLAGVWIVWLLTACSNDRKPIINPAFADSLITQYAKPVGNGSSDSVMQFWKNRINPSRPGLVSESQYANCLSIRYHLYGDIWDLQHADSVVRKIDLDYNHREAQPNLTLVRYAIMQHRFRQADGYLQQAKRIGLKRYDFLTTSFDVDFELGRFAAAKFDLRQLGPSADYGYFFRRSKMDHLNGLMDSSINAMTRAASLESGNRYLLQIAYASLGDLYLHTENPAKAADYFRQSLELNCADFHSMMALGWIALVHDQNYPLADRVFRFVLANNKLPDPLLKLSESAGARGDSAGERAYAVEFAKRASDSAYGPMYHKYLIELYTGVLDSPAQAEILSRSELTNRSTPQTYTWYAWSLYCNHKTEQAYEVFEQHVSGQPLEGLELYWMGKLMQGLGKGYNASQFFQAAVKNKYDLSPRTLRDLEKNLE
jgi:tetratricopeptide (TPR) repeat protein